MLLNLYWIPLGAGDRAGQSVVRFCGRTYEATAALFARRPPCGLYHAALVAETVAGSVSIEMAPIPDGNGRVDRGVVAEGPVGMRSLGRLRIFRYEVRRWPDGTIPDLHYAIASPVRITDDPLLVERVLGALPQVPTLVWGRDELRTGEMWNSNSVVAWSLAQAELDKAAGVPPNNGRAPGWTAGIVAANQAAAAQ